MLRCASKSHAWLAACQVCGPFYQPAAFVSRHQPASYRYVVSRTVCRGISHCLACPLALLGRQSIAPAELTTAGTLPRNYTSTCLQPRCQTHHSALKHTQLNTAGPDGKPLIKACHVSSSNPPPFDPPDVVVTTPGALVTLFNDRGSSYGPQWSAEGVSSRAAFVVADEADLLCQGGYVKDLTRLLDVSTAADLSY
jgi:hypothetical protein